MLSRAVWAHYDLGVLEMHECVEDLQNIRSDAVSLMHEIESYRLLIPYARERQHLLLLDFLRRYVVLVQRSVLCDGGPGGQ